MLSSFHAINIALMLANQVGSDLMLEDQLINADRFSLGWDLCTICIFFFLNAPSHGSEAQPSLKTLEFMGLLASLGVSESG